MLPHPGRGQNAVLVGDGVVDEAALLLGDPLDLAQDALRYDVALGHRPQGHVDRTREQAQHPVLGGFRDGPVEGNVRDYRDALLELVHLYRLFDYEQILLRTSEGGQLRRRYVRNLSDFPQLLERELVYVKQ